MKKTKVTSKNSGIGPPTSIRQRRLATAAAAEPLPVVDEKGLLADLRELINDARQRVATVANSTQTMLYWNVGRRLLKENLQDGRAAYGKQILATLSRELTAEFGRGFSYAGVARMIQFSQVFADESHSARPCLRAALPHA